MERRGRLPSVYHRLINCSNQSEGETMMNNISKRTLLKIYRRTEGQGSNTDWLFYRKGIVTGTLTKRIWGYIYENRSNAETINKAISKVISFDLRFPAIVYGRESESLASRDFVQQYKKNHRNVKFFEYGLKLDENIKYFGGSVDGVIQCDCCGKFIIEIKAPYRLRDDSVHENFSILEYLNEDKSLKTIHPYFFQIQSYLGLYNLPKAFLIVWSKMDFLVIDVNFDSIFYKKLTDAVQEYYKNIYLPSLYREAHV